MAVVDLVERYRHGNLTAATAILDGAQIVASISGIAALRLGRLALTARAAAAEAAAVGAPLSEQSQLVLQWARAQARVVPIAAVNLGADAVTLAVMVPEAAAQYDAIENSTADPETKRRAKIMLLGQLALTLGLTSLSVRGNVREITLGRDLNVELVSGLPVLTPVGRSVVGEQVVTRRPAVAAETTETSFRAAAEQQVAGIRTRLPGPAGETLAEVEDQALRTAWRVEESRRILNPIFEGTAPLAAADRNLKSALLRFSTQTIDTLNNPGLTQAQKQARLRSLVDAFEAANAQLRGHVDFAGPRRAISEVGAAAGEGIYVVDARGGLTAGEGGRSAGSFQELVDRVLQANNVNVFHGIDTEYVLVVNAPNARGFAEVHILTRPRGAGAAPAQLPPQIPGPPRATGRFIVDIGAGESAFAIDMVPPNERAGAIVVQTELPQTFANPAQARRGLGIEQVAPRGDRGSVLVLADALQNLELLFGTPATGQGVRRLFINNVNAHYSPAQYERLARALGRVAGAGTRVEVQWDRSPERAGQPQGSRGHIEGPALRAALQQFSGRTFHYETAPPVSYPYSIQPSRRVGGAVDPNPPTPPDPTGPLGGRAIITFE